MPPAPVVVEKTVVNGPVAAGATWIHCGSLNADDQRVPVFPSTALVAGVPAFSVEDAAAGFPCEIRGSAAAAVPDSAATATAAAIVTVETAAASNRLGPRALVRVADMALLPRGGTGRE